MPVHRREREICLDCGAEKSPGYSSCSECGSIFEDQLKRYPNEKEREKAVNEAIKKRKDQKRREFNSPEMRELEKERRKREQAWSERKQSKSESVLDKILDTIDKIYNILYNIYSICCLLISVLVLIIFFGWYPLIPISIIILIIICNKKVNRKRK